MSSPSCSGEKAEELSRTITRPILKNGQSSKIGHEEGGRSCVRVGASGVGTLRTNDFASSHQYITKKEYDRLSKLPYWGYCKVCGAERKGGYCGDDNCFESFATKTAGQ
jgi:hypothetical protein